MQIKKALITAAGSDQRKLAMQSLVELSCNYINVLRMRGQQLKEVSQLDGWLRDGSKEYIDSICEWE